MIAYLVSIVHFGPVFFLYFSNFGPIFCFCFGPAFFFIVQFLRCFAPVGVVYTVTGPVFAPVPGAATFVEILLQF